MGPITLIDKSVIQGLNEKEVTCLERYYSLVISPILMREILSMLAKEPRKGKDWEAILSSIASKVDTLDSYLPPDATLLARQNLLGIQIPMDGRVPMTGGTPVHSRDGKFGVIFEEPPEKAVLRGWAQKRFTSYYRATADVIRSLDQGIDLRATQAYLEKELSHFPKFKALSELANWLNQTYYGSMGQEYHLLMMARDLLNQSETEQMIASYRDKGVSYQEFAPYGSYYYRVNTLFVVGLSQGLIPTSKGAKAHLDVQYLYYLPFCMAFTSADKFLLEAAERLKRPDQVILRGQELKLDLAAITAYFDGLSEEEKKAFREKNGMYPPEGVPGLTLTAWARLMRPRPQAVGVAPRLSRAEQSELAKEITKYMTESIRIGPGRPESYEKLKRTKQSIIDRNSRFVNGVFEIVGTNETEDWDRIRYTFNKVHVKKIYNLHADIWHPTDPFKDLANEFTTDEMARCLYLGDIEAFDVVQQIWRWSLSFDQILVPDPFHSPWPKKAEYNPIASPAQYETDTLKLVYFLSLVAPLVANGQLVLVPDPTDFDLALKKKMMDLAKSALGAPENAKLIAGEKERLKRMSLFSLLRVLARLPIEERRAAIEKSFGKDNIEAGLAFCEEVRAKDPLCITGSECSADLIISRTGANYELSLLLSALYNAVPMPTLASRTTQFKQQAEPCKPLAPLNTFLANLTVVEASDPFFNAFARQKGALEVFREIMNPIMMSGKIIEPKSLAEKTEEHEAECKFVASVFSRSSGIAPSTILKKHEIEVLYSSKGFRTANAETLIAAFDQSLLERLPNFCITVPPTEVPDIPFLGKG